VGQRTVLAGRYALISPLGRGGMGQVWEGRDERLGRPVAVKLLTGDMLAGRAEPDDLVRRFTREAAVTAGLEHPGVPTIYDAGEYDGGLFLVMELVDGYTISDLIAEQGPLPVPWVAGIGAQVAAVLAMAHERGIIHRDIKPQNVMLTGDGTAKILDFGVAGIVNQRMTSTGVAVGTPAYMAPEQIHSLPATPRTDLYTLGCLLYEMLAGEPVFAATSPAGLMRKHLEQAPAPLHRDDLPPWLETLVRQLLEKDPARRPADAREAYDRLLPYVERPGPLGDINPAAVSRSGMGLYSLLLVRLSGTDPGVSGPPGPQLIAHQPTTQRVARPGVGWTLVHSLWVLPTLLFGVATWLSFGYIAARHQRLSWLVAGATYLVLAVTAFALIASGPDPGNGSESAQTIAGIVIGLVLWPTGFIHALWVNFTVCLPLRAKSSA
jgi:serine/threonine protein kinase